MFATFTLGYNHARRRVRTPVEQFQPFEQGRILGLREAGWTYRRSAAHVVSVEHSHTRRPCSGRPRSTGERQDWHIVRAAVAARTASRHMLHLLFH